jgi:hypothetical protein
MRKIPPIALQRLFLASHLEALFISVIAYPEAADGTDKHRAVVRRKWFEPFVHHIMANGARTKGRLYTCQTVGDRPTQRRARRSPPLAPFAQQNLGPSVPRSDKVRDGLSLAFPDNANAEGRSGRGYGKKPAALPRPDRWGRVGPRKDVRVHGCLLSITKARTYEEAAFEFIVNGGHNIYSQRSRFP